MTQYSVSASDRENVMHGNVRSFPAPRGRRSVSLHAWRVHWYEPKQSSLLFLIAFIQCEYFRIRAHVQRSRIGPMAGDRDLRRG